MNARSAIAVALLLTFPVSTFAQTPASNAGEPGARLDLNSIKTIRDDTAPKPFSIPFPNAKRNAFQQTAAAPSCAESEARGRTDADQRKFNQGWFWGGAGISALIGGLGLGVAPAAAAVHKPKPKATPAGLDQACYAQGFGGKARHDNALTAFFGSLVGLGVWILLYATVY